jgi:hypothetical protein
MLLRDFYMSSWFLHTISSLQGAPHSDRLSRQDSMQKKVQTIEIVINYYNYIWGTMAFHPRKMLNIIK